MDVKLIENLEEFCDRNGITVGLSNFRLMMADSFDCGEYGNEIGLAVYASLGSACLLADRSLDDAEKLHFMKYSVINIEHWNGDLDDYSRVFLKAYAQIEQIITHIEGISDPLRAIILGGYMGRIMSKDSTSGIDHALLEAEKIKYKLKYGNADLVDAGQFKKVICDLFAEYAVCEISLKNEAGEDAYDQFKGLVGEFIADLNLKPLAAVVNGIKLTTVAFMMGLLPLDAMRYVAAYVSSFTKVNIRDDQDD